MQQRDKVAERLNRKATRSMSFRNYGGVFSKITERIPITPKYQLFKGTETYSWKLETTGASATDEETLILKDDGRIEEINIDFPSGSEYEYYVLLSLDGAQIFPSELSQELRGDHKLRSFSVDIPYQRDSRLKVSMVSDADLQTNTTKACWVDITCRNKPRI